MDRLVLIDGHAILHRAYHAYPALTTTKGELINAVYGFTSILLTTLRQLNPKYVVCAFDLAKPTFRHKQFKAYKAHRPKVDEELKNQIPKTKTVVRALSIPIFEKEGFEADDVIGSLARRAEVAYQDFCVHKSPAKKSKRSMGAKAQGCSPAAICKAIWAGKHVHSKNLTGAPRAGLEVVIVTGDKDALQLIDNNIKVFMPQRGKQPAQMFDRKLFLKKYSFEPRQLIDFKALAGDASDGIPGVKGIGPKTATKLIVQFGDLKSIYDNLDKIEQRGRLKLKSDKDNAFMSLQLAEIVTDVPIKFNLLKCKLLDYDKEKVIKLFEELEFRSLIKRLPGAEKIEIKDKPRKKEKQMGLF